ncbi:MAG: helix-turn-helix domain-containing protein [Planctomycetes bacterium]|nr:helix-turn-helix domain-containing protein [Planctomycetota bacterium]
MPQLPAGQFLGRRTHRVRIGNATITEADYAPGARLPRHSHACAHFCFVLGGGYHETLGRNDLERRPMSLTFQPAGVEHEERHFGAGRHLLIEIAGLDREARPTAVDLSGTLAVGICRRLQRELACTDPEAELAREEHLIAIAAFAHTAPPPAKPEPQWLVAIDEWLQAAPLDTPTLSELAAHVGVHRSHLARTFLRHRHRTIGDELRRLRSARAADLLASTKLPLPDIALRAGFADQAHFTRVFGRLTGCTPATFRRATR